MSTIPQFFIVFQHYSSPEFNCSAIHEPGEWWSLNRGEKQTSFGLWSLIFGILSEMLYIPCAIVLFIKRSSHCYSIMLWLAIIDMTALYVNSISFGIMLLEGAVYCTYPLYNYITGCIALGMWCGASCGCLILVINRMAAVLNVANQTKFLLILATLYTAYFNLLTPPYVSYPHAINNLIVVISTSILYIMMCIILTTRFKTMGSTQSRAKNSSNLPIFVQASLICLFNVAASLIYVYMQWISAPLALIQIGQTSWQLSHGVPPFIYLTINRTIRLKVASFLTGNKTTKTSTVIASVVTRRTSNGVSSKENNC